MPGDAVDLIATEDAAIEAAGTPQEIEDADETPDTPRTTDPTQPQLAPGDEAPDFSLQSDDGKTYSRDDLLGRRYVIYFYPKDNTPGCTTEACDFRDSLSKFNDTDTVVLGVSPDSISSHQRFRDKHGLNFPLLSDPDRSTAEAFGALGEKTMYGKTAVRIIRSTFLVGADGKLEHVWSPVRVDGHVEAVLDSL